ncbi:MAG TPA: hypothetical protein VGL71_03335, partial [Urbifossiella sp.]
APAPNPPANPEPAGNESPWERKAENFTGSLPGGAATGWHDSAQKQKSKRSQIIFAGVVFFVLLGAFIGLMSWFGPVHRTVELVALPVSQYDFITWGANPTAQGDAEQVRSQFSKGGLAQDHQEAKNLRHLIAYLRDRPDPNEPLVVYISALAIVRSDRVFLLPGDARIEQPEGWVPLADLLEAMARCEALEKALLLDIARTPADPFRGPLYDDVAAQLDKQLKEFAPEFPVLSSCSPGERNLVIPELRLSAFAAFIVEGLRGDADGYPPSREPDGKISFGELESFVKSRVSRWADRVPDARQMPIRYGPESAGFILARERTAPPPPEGDAAAPAVPDYPAELRAAWMLRDAARNDERMLLAPDQILALEEALLRAEERYLAGIPWEEERYQTAMIEVPARFAERLHIIPTSPNFHVDLLDYRSERKEPKAKQPPPKEIPANPADVLEKWIKFQFPFKDETGKLRPANEPEAEKVAEELAMLLSDKDRAVDCFAAFWNDKLLKEAGLSHERIANLLNAIDRKFFQSLPLTSEQILLRRIAQARVPEIGYPEAVLSLLKAEQAFSEAVAATSGRLPEGFLRVRHLLDEGDRDKREGEELLLKSELTRADKAEALRKLTEAEKKLNAARDGANSVKAAHRVWAEALAKLHETLPDTIEPNGIAPGSWRNAAKDANDLDALLAAPDPLAFDSLDEAAAKLRRSLVKLNYFAHDKLRSHDDLLALAKGAQERPVTGSPGELQRLLTGSLLAADERAALALAARKVSAYRFGELRAKFDAETDRKPFQSSRPNDLRMSVERCERRIDASL